MSINTQFTINIQYTIQHTIVIDIDFLKIWLLKKKIENDKQNDKQNAIEYMKEV